MGGCCGHVKLKATLWWNVTGTMWTLNIWRPRFEPLLHEPSDWCDKTVYVFAVFQLSSTYAATFVFMFLLLLLTCF
ncbi:hypothetical protein MAR_022186 [Mya arenaria]|uniref:Uncharacterized protein n=1 Tax=Mya arenaria TaxID=6604 RepID=A0ABY7DP05_MYAAR|nr:hypothetical protein MAR_022186 [Mya arenaria]